MPTPSENAARVEELERALSRAVEALEVVVAIARTNATGAIQHSRNALRDIRPSLRTAQGEKDG